MDRAQALAMAQAAGGDWQREGNPKAATEIATAMSEAMFGPSGDATGALRFMYSIPAGRQMAAAIGATKDKIQDPQWSWRQHYDARKYGNDQQVKSEAPTPAGYGMAAMIPQFLMGPAGQTAYSVGGSVSREDPLALAGVDALANAVPGHGPSGPYIVGPNMAAPIVVHASPNKWSGQPTRAKVGTGEGGAAYGEGLYGSIPANAKGIDARYREQGLADWAVDPAKGKAAVIDRLRRFAMEEQDKYIRSGTVRPQPGDPMPIAPEAYPALKQADFLENSYGGTLEPWEARDMVKRYTNGTQHVDDLVRAPDRGSFHVWDVPDRLIDYETPLNKQAPEIVDALQSSGVMPPGGFPSFDSTKAKILERIDAIGFSEANAGYLRRRLSGVKDWKSLSDVVDILDDQPSREAYALGNRSPHNERTTVSHLGDDAGARLKGAGIVGHRYLGEAGSSGEALGVPNFVIYDDAAVKPLGTFDSADAFLQSDLYKQLAPRIAEEEAALVARYPHLRGYFGLEGKAKADAIPKK